MRKCKNIPVGKFGTRKKCCIKCRKCASFQYTGTPRKRADACETKLKKCFWKGPYVVIRKHRKCSVRPYGRNKDRKRCCSWKVRCIGKHCKVVHRKCSWEGCVISFHKKKIIADWEWKTIMRNKDFAVNGIESVVMQNAKTIIKNANGQEK